MFCSIIFYLIYQFTTSLLCSGLCCCCGAFWFSLFTFCCRAVVRWAAARSLPPRGPALHGEAVGSCPRPLLSPVHMSPTHPLSASPIMPLQGQGACAHLPLDTSPHQTMKEATTTGPHHAKPLPTTVAPLRDTVRHAPLGTSPHAHLFMAHLGPLTEAAGVGLRLGTAWRVMGPSTSMTTSTNGTMNPLPMSRAFPMATRIHMGEILTHTHAHLGLPATGPLLPLTPIHVGCPMAIAHPPLPRIGGDHLGHPLTHTTAPLMPEGLERACMNLIVKRMRMTGASNHRKRRGKGRRGDEEQQHPVLWPWICRLLIKQVWCKCWGDWTPSTPSTFTPWTLIGGRGGGEGVMVLQVAFYTFCVRLK